MTDCRILGLANGGSAIGDGEQDGRFETMQKRQRMANDGWNLTSGNVPLEKTLQQGSAR